MPSHAEILRHVLAKGNLGSVTTAYHYLRDLASSVGKREAAVLFTGGHSDYRMATKAARRRLVLHSPQLSLELSSKAASSEASQLPEGVSAEIISRVSTVDKDWDGDIVHPEGLVFDTKAPLLWMHAQNMPIGTMRGVVVQDEEKAICKYHTAETQLALDAVKLFKIGALRNSIGFKVLEAEPLGFVDGVNGKQVPTGFDIKRAVVLENSAVAVPANPNADVLRVYAKEYDALWSAASEKAFKHPVVKQYAAALYEKRPSVFKGTSFDSNDGVFKGASFDPKDVASLETALADLTTEIKGLKMDSTKTVELDSEKSMSWGMDEYADGSHEQAINGVERSVKGYMCEKGECDDEHRPAVMATYGDKAYVAMRKWNGESYDKKTYQVNYKMDGGQCKIDGHKSVKIKPNILDDFDVNLKWMKQDGLLTKGGVDLAKPAIEAKPEPTLKEMLAKSLVGDMDQATEDFVIQAAEILAERRKLAAFC